MHNGIFTIKAKLGKERIQYIHEGHLVDALNKLLEMSFDKEQPINHVIVNRYE
jgi:hypothetical protein